VVQKSGLSGAEKARKNRHRQLLTLLQHRLSIAAKAPPKSTIVATSLHLMATGEHVAARHTQPSCIFSLQAVRADRARGHGHQSGLASRQARTTVEGQLNRRLLGDRTLQDKKRPPPARKTMLTPA
jgi:hypothetical protein